MGVGREGRTQLTTTVGVGPVRRHFHGHPAFWAVLFLHRYPEWRKSGFESRCIIVAPSDSRSLIDAEDTNKSGVEAPRGLS